MAYPEKDWICFGTLTTEQPTSGKTLIGNFKELMDSIGRCNESFGKRLHWFARVEGKNGVGAEDRDPNKRTHLHFMLGKHKVTDGHKHQFTITDACQYLKRAWDPRFGMADVRPYDSTLDGLDYVLKAPGGPKSDGWEDTVEISPALLGYLKKEKLLADYQGWDPFALNIALTLKRQGVPVIFGKEAIARERRAA